MMSYKYIAILAVSLILNGCGSTRKTLADIDMAEKKRRMNITANDPITNMTDGAADTTTTSVRAPQLYSSNSQQHQQSRQPATHQSPQQSHKQAPPATEEESKLNMHAVTQTDRCHGPRLGIYSWDQKMTWRTTDSALLKHLSGSNAKAHTCGDITVNVADFSNAHKIYNSEVLVPFMKNIRLSGNDGTVYLSYGDVRNKNVTACRMFIDTYFEWVASISADDAPQIQPIGVSFDIEHFPIGETEKLLKYAQSKKAEILSKGTFAQDGILIQWTIEGRVNPVDTDAVMKYADSALMMAYRNYMSKPGDEYGDKNGILRRMSYMLKEQCRRCLNDDYARRHYRAKITVMVESSCNVDEYCDRVSFCAFDGEGRSGGASYVREQLDLLDRGLVSSGLMTREQKDRLMNRRAPYSVHHWEWFQCYYQDPSDSNHLCTDYHSLAGTCRGG